MKRPAFRDPVKAWSASFAPRPAARVSIRRWRPARAGAATGFVGALGHDAFGAGARAFLAVEGIEFHGSEKPDQASGTAVVMVDASGQNQIIVALGANAALQTEDISAEWLTGAKIVVGQLEIFLPSALEALRVARSAGAVTILNPAPMHADFDLAFLEHTDVLVPNESEFAALLNLLPAFDRGDFREEELVLLAPEEFHTLCRRLGPPVVLITLGARGSFLSLPDRAMHIPARGNVVAVDTTGAGDAFVGAFAAAYLEFGGDAVTAARFANAAAGISVTRPGAAPSVAYRREIDAAFSSDN